MQLTFDQAFAGDPAWRSGGSPFAERYGDRHSLLVTWRTDDSGITVRFESTRQREAPALLHVRVVAPVSLKAPVPDAWRWSMAKGIPMANRCGDLFAKISSWAYREIYVAEEDNEGRSTRRRSAAGAGTTRRTMRTLYARLRALAIHAAACCDPSARSLALRFPTHLRFRVYKLIVDDPSGRLAQLAAACPGALGFAIALAEQGETPVSERLLEGVVAGRRLNPLLDEAIEGWAAGIRRRVDEDARFCTEQAAWRRVAHAGFAEAARIHAAQRLLIRRAGPAVCGWHLWLPPPIAFAPEDVPRATRANAAWFKIMKCSGTTMAYENEPDAALRFAIARFASRHAPAIWAMRRRSRRVRDEIGELRDYLAASGRIPSARSDPEELLRASRRWHAELRRAVRGDRELERNESPLLDVTFPKPPLPAWCRADVDIAPIQDVRALMEEARRMRHCVATRLPEMMTGRSAVYHATVKGRPLTIEILRRGAVLHLGDCKGVSNRLPTKRERRALAPWLQGVATGSADW